MSEPILAFLLVMTGATIVYGGVLHER